MADDAHDPPTSEPDAAGGRGVVGGAGRSVADGALPMTARAARQEAIERVFVDAVAEAPGARVALVERSELDDAARREVIDLLRFHVAEVFTPGARDTGGDEGLARALVGRSIGGCRLVRLVGTGGMGAVFEAEQSEPSRRVAVKLLRSELASGNALRRFQLEAELMSRLEHPSIARIYAAGTHRDDARAASEGESPDAPRMNPLVAAPYLVMEFVEDARHIARFARERGLTPSESVRLFVDVVDAVAYGHARGVLHRDLKPANILVGGDGRPRVIDFGVAKAIDPDARGMRGAIAMTRTTAFVGTLQYMSPEQCGATRDGADVRTDVYALGLILFEMLAGRPPYAVPADAGLLAAARIVGEAPAPPLGSIDRRCRGDLERIVAKALAKDPAMRYQSAGELAADMRRLLAHEPILAREPSAAYRAWRFAQRNPALVTLSALATTALATTAVVALVFAGEAAHQRDVASMRSAQYATEIGDFPAAREALAAVPAGARGFEWGALWSRAAGGAHEVAFPSSVSNIYDIESARGGRVFVASQDDTTLVIDARSGDVLARAVDRREGAATETLSFDVDREANRAVRGCMGLAPVAIALDDGRIVWEGPKPKELFAAVAISPDGTRVAFANSGEPLRTVRIGARADAATTLAERGLAGFIRSLDWSPDGALLAVGIEPATLLAVDAETLETRWSAPLNGREDVPDVRWSADGRFVSATSFAGSTQVFARDGSPHGAVSAATMDQSASYAGELSPDATRIASGAMDQRPRIHEIATGRAFRLPGHEQQAWSAAWGDGGAVLATTGREVRLWNPARHDPAGTAVASTPSQGLRLSPDGSLAATILDGSGDALIAEIPSMREVARLKGPVRRIALDAARRRVAVWSGSELAIHALPSAGTPDEARPLPGWALAGAELAAVGLARADGSAAIDAIEWFDDGRLAASVGNERLVALDGATGNATGSLDLTPFIRANPVISEPGPIGSLRPFGAKGIAAASTLPPGLLVWDGAARAPRVGTSDQPYRRLAVAAEGSLLATGDVDGVIRLSNARSMRELWRTDALTATCRFLAIRPQEDRIAAASIDRRLAILDASTGELLVRLPLPAPPADLRFTPDGRRLVVGLANGRVIMLDDAR